VEHLHGGDGGSHALGDVVRVSVRGSELVFEKKRQMRAVS